MVARLRVEVHTHDRGAAYTLFGTSVGDGQTAAIADGIEAEFQHIESRRSLGWPEVVAFFITVSAAVPPSVAANLITSWLLSKFPHRPESTIIERSEVEFEEGQLKRVFRERIEMRRR